MLANKALSSAPSAEPVFVESVFSTYLYTGNGSTQTITNGIDLSGKGGLVWVKRRDATGGTPAHRLVDTSRGAGLSLFSDSANAQGLTGQIYQFNNNGFGVDTGGDAINASGGTYASWTFRKAPKFFDVVTYTGNGTNRTIAHNLGSVPGCIIVKRTDSSADWQVYHRSLANTEYIFLNGTDGKQNFNGNTRWNSTTPTSTVFSLGTATSVNASGGTYVAYLFAHDAGGFGLTGTDNVISCGSYTGNGNTPGPVINLGYEPQWLLIKRIDSISEWYLFDSMRGFTATGSRDFFLHPNNTSSEVNTDRIAPIATGFQPNSDNETNANGGSYIYIAIRRGPMKVPTSGTSVFSPIASSSSQGTKQTSGFPVDLQIADHRNAVEACRVFDRLRGFSTVPTNGNAQRLNTNSTDAESADTSMNQYFDNTGFQTGSNYSGISSIFWNFRRAPGFFDVVAFTPNADTFVVNHNLKSVPELILVKGRNLNFAWRVFVAPLGANGGVVLNQNAANATRDWWGGTAPSLSQFTSFISGGSGFNFIAYLFATVPGVSKVGSYTGTGTTKQIDCGFTGGARFVLIKRTDSTGDWYVWDTARGIVAGNDPYLLLNSTAAEVTSTDYIDTYSAGFEISSTAPAAINANGGTFIFLAIA